MHVRDDEHLLDQARATVGVGDVDRLLAQRVGRAQLLHARQRRRRALEDDLAQSKAEACNQYAIST